MVSLGMRGIKRILKSVECEDGVGMANYGENSKKKTHFILNYY